MELVSVSTELHALKSICSGKEVVATKILGTVSEDWFEYPPVKEAFNRLLTILGSATTVPDWSTLKGDPILSKTTRKALGAYKKKPVQDAAKAQVLLDNLDQYRMARAIYNIGLYIEEVTTGEVEGGALEHLQTINQMLSDSQKIGFNEQDFSHLGGPNTARDRVRRIIRGLVRRVIPTGFKAFDDRNGGLILKSLVLIGATTGGGKCLDYDSLVATNRGILKLGEIWETASGLGPTKLVRGLLVQTTQGPREVSQVHRTKGVMVTVQTDNSGWIVGLPTHKLQVLDEVTGSTVLTPIGELQIGDYILKSASPLWNTENETVPLMKPNKAPSPSMEIPYGVRTGSKEDICKFLRTLYTNAKITLTTEIGAQKTRIPSIEYTTDSFRLVQQLGMALDLLGIRYVITRAACIYAVSITGQIDFERFGDCIGFSSKDIGDQYELIRCSLKGSPMVDSYVPTGKLIKALFTRLQPSKATGVKAFLSTPAFISQELYNRIVEQLHYPLMSKRLSLQLVREIQLALDVWKLIGAFWTMKTVEYVENLLVAIESVANGSYSRVVGIEPGVEKDAYDLCVPGPHTYAVNGVMGHNSTMASQLALNMSRAGESVCIVPLEMGIDELWARVLSNVSSVPVTKIIQNKLTSNEREKMATQWKKLEKTVSSTHGRLTLFEPRNSPTIEQLAAILMPFKYKVVIIDYISLLQGVNDEDSWRKLGQVSKFCKNWAKATDSIIVLVVQIGNDAEVRYSKALREDADNAWFWVVTDEMKQNESVIIEIQQQKARNQDPFRFSLNAELGLSRITDLSHTSFDKGGLTDDDDYLNDLSSD